MVIAYVGLGANLGDRKENIETALDHLRETEGVEVLKVSRLIETAPVGGPSQPAYLNGVAKVRTTLSARRLLDALLAAEKAAGRKRTVTAACPSRRSRPACCTRPSAACRWCRPS